jgi:hypothetical protein
MPNPGGLRNVLISLLNIRGIVNSQCAPSRICIGLRLLNRSPVNAGNHHSGTGTATATSIWSTGAVGIGALRNSHPS